MKNIIIGTAGHIDHGKTTLIKALTGRETDRLKEEKKRGISIELGFTYFDLPSGKRAGVIDVPGHEKFIRNMLAGVGGMDIVMLVIASDEGVMPQTKEHLDILSILKVKKGIIVLTKASLVDEEWLELVKEDIKEKVKDTFLQNAKIIAVDSVEGKGIDLLAREIDRLAEELESRNINAPVRLPIDRIFTITGFGTVITGTLVEGKITVEDTLEILPNKTKVRIRNIQVHGKSVKEAYAGQRVAINLANVKKEDIERGQILAQIDSIEPTMMIDCRLNLLKDVPRSVNNRDRVRIYHGASEILARVILLDQEELQGGDSAYVQLRLEEETAVKKGDNLVVRFYSPMETIGGAIAIDVNPKKHKRYDEKVIKDLEIRETGSIEDIVEKQIERHSGVFPELNFIAKLTAQQTEEIREIVNALVKEGKVVLLGNDTVIHTQHYHDIKNHIGAILKDYHQRNPLKVGMLKEEIKSKLFPKDKSKVVDILLELFVSERFIKMKEKFISLFDFQIVYSEEHQKIKDRLEKIYLDNPFAPPKLEEIMDEMDFSPREIERVYKAILGDILIKLNQDMVIHSAAYNESKTKLIKYVEDRGSITASEFRDLLGTSRKYAIAILEYMDNQKVTKRIEEKRILY